MATMTKAAARRKDKLSRKINKANIKGNTKRATRLAKKQSKIVKTGKTGAGRAIQKVKNTADKIKKKVDKIKGSKLGKIVTAASSTYSAIKKGKFDKAAKGLADTAKAVTAKRSYPKKEKKVKMVGTKKPMLTTAKKKAGGSFDKPLSKKRKEGLKKRKAILQKVRKKGEAKVSASIKPKMAMKKPMMSSMKKPMMTGVIKPMLSGKKKTSKLSRLDRKSARKAAAAQRKGVKLRKMQAERDKLARGLYDKLGRKDYYSKVKGDPSSLSSKDKKTIRKINKLYKSEGRKDRAINRKVRKINKVAKKQGSPKRIGRQSGDPYNNYKPYKR